MEHPRRQYGPVESKKALLQLVEEIRAGYPNQLILFRGQCELHNSISSGRSRPKFTVNKLTEAGWHGYLRYMLGVQDRDLSGALVQAILQHYGPATHYVDLTSSPEIAAWFSTNEYKYRLMQFMGTSLRSIPQATYERKTEGVGYILVLVFPNPDELLRKDYLVNLTHLPETFSRPHKQSGWLMYDNPPAKPTPTNFWVATIAIDRSRYSTDLAIGDVFPERNNDPVYKRMLTLPFVQTPSAYFKGKEERVDEKRDKALDAFLFANPCVEVTEYYDDDGVGDHKWSDYTLYEPHPMRMWKRWRYDLSKDHPGIEGDVRDAIKITVSPTALSVLRANASEDCEWPLVGADALFFTYAAIDHDKVIEHEPPYRGKWLIKKGDLIVEKEMESDREIMSVGQGFGYLLRNGKLDLCEIDNACTCGHPEIHLESTRALLQLPRLVKEGKVLFLPHPRLSQLGWYFVITENDQQGILASVAGFRQVVKVVHQTLHDTLSRTKVKTIKGKKRARNP